MWVQIWGEDQLTLIGHFIMRIQFNDFGLFLLIFDHYFWLFLEFLPDSLKYLAVSWTRHKTFMNVGKAFLSINAPAQMINEAWFWNKRSHAWISRKLLETVENRSTEWTSRFSSFILQHQRLPQLRVNQITEVFDFRLRDLATILRIQHLEHVFCFSSDVIIG